MRDREIGRVKFFCPEKGFGFAQRDSGPPDVFIHRSQLPPDVMLETDDRIEFDVEPNRRDPSKFRAINVELIERA